MPGLAILPIYQPAWEQAHPDTVPRYGQPDTMFTTKASTMILFFPHFPYITLKFFFSFPLRINRLSLVLSFLHLFNFLGKRKSNIAM